MGCMKGGNVKDFSEVEFQSMVDFLGLPAYRGRQIAKGIFHRGAVSFDEMSDLPKDLRKVLNETFTISRLNLVSDQISKDGTKKFLFVTGKKTSIESVLIPDKKRRTLCVSTQVGCRMACSFCVTGTLGLIAQLSAADIIDQFMEVNRQSKDPISHVVLMGMGEPLDNYNNVARAVRILTHPPWIGLSPRKITLSTCGLVPALRRFKEEFPKVRVAVSVGAPDDKRRDQLIPVNRRYPLRTLMDACRELPLQPRERITFEYTLIRNLNDSLQDAHLLARLLHGIRCKVNLLPFNPSSRLSYECPPNETVDRFARGLLSKGVMVTVRKSRGRDIDAACGLLAVRPPD